MLERVLKKLERFIKKRDPAFILREREDESYKRMMKVLKKEASYYSGKEITEKDILKKGKENETTSQELPVGCPCRHPAGICPLVGNRSRSCSYHNCPHYGK